MMSSQLISIIADDVSWEEPFDNDFEGWILSCIHSDAARGWYVDTATGCAIIDQQLHFTRYIICAYFIKRFLKFSF